jgi:hypothetical protein
MSKSVRSIKDLPSWFNLAKYESLADLRPVDWLWQFVARAKLFELAELQDDCLPELLQILGAAPILSEDSDIRLRALVMQTGLVDPAEDGAPAASGVYLGNVFDHLNDARTIDPTKLAAAVAVDRKLRSPATPLDEQFSLAPMLDQLAKPLAYLMPNPGPMVPLYIDATMPDWLLLRQLRAALHEVRRLPGVPKNEDLAARQPRPATWLRAGVLPYLDLNLWAKHTGRRIPRRVMADAIFPPGEGGEDLLYDTTEPWARQLISADYLRLVAGWACFRDLGEMQD